MDKEEQIRMAKNAYAREWRKKNPDKQKKIYERFYLKKVKEMEENKANEISNK